MWKLCRVFRKHSCLNTGLEGHKLHLAAIHPAILAHVHDTANNKGNADDGTDDGANNDGHVGARVYVVHATLLGGHRGNPILELRVAHSRERPSQGVAAENGRVRGRVNEVELKLNRTRGVDLHKGNRAGALDVSGSLSVCGGPLLHGHGGECIKLAVSSLDLGHTCSNLAALCANLVNSDGGVRNYDLAFLVSVAEVVVTGAHVSVHAILGDLSGPKVEVSGTVVELRKLTTKLAVVVDGESTGISNGEAQEGNIVEVGRVCEHVLAERSHALSGKALPLSVLLSSEHNNVVTVGTTLALAGIVLGVGLATSPLNMDVIAVLQVEVLGHEVVLSTRESLHNVTALASHIQVCNACTSRDTGRSGTNGKAVRAVLESTTILGGVDGEAKLNAETKVDCGVVLEKVVLGSGGTILGSKVKRFGNAAVNVGVPGIILAGSNVVSHTQDATLMGVVGNGPVEADRVATNAVAKVVVTAQVHFTAHGSGQFPGRDLSPVTTDGRLVASALILAHVLCVD
eukprot:Colp12_sorted_trinity150504_noHs@30576